MPTLSPNLVESRNPTFYERVQDLETAVVADEATAVVTNPGAGQFIQGGAIHLVPLAVPGAPTIVATGAGSGTQVYKIVARIGTRTTKAGATATTGGAGPTTLDATHFNTLAWSAVPYAIGYDVYRTTGGPSQGRIAVNVQSGFVDNGVAADATATSPSSDSTGMLEPNAVNDLVIRQMATPNGVAVTGNGTAGITTVGYVVAAVSVVGVAPAAEVQLTTANATLSSTNSTTITWLEVPGALSYNIYRSTAAGTPSTTGLIGNVLQGAVYSFTDTGIAGTLNVPTVNTTGAFSPDGPVFGGAQVFPLAAPATNSTVGASTLTAAQILSGIIVRAGSQVGGITDTTPTAAALVAALQGVKVGSFFDFTIRNTTGQTETLGAGSGVTLASGNTNTTPTVNSHTYRAVFTNVTPGAEAVTIYSMGAPSAY